jgi:hypothetical protein
MAKRSPGAITMRMCIPKEKFDAPRSESALSRVAISNEPGILVSLLMSC